MEGGPKSLNAGLKLDEEGNEGDGTLEPRRTRKEGHGSQSNAANVLSY